MVFKNKEEFIEQARKDGTYPSVLHWARKQKDLQTILKNIPHEWCYWCIRKKYKQFSKHFDWYRLYGSDWAALLRDQPQFAKHCNWNKLSGSDWYVLLREKPQFSKNCDWNKLDGSDWSRLLRKQPQFAKHCNWNKLSNSDLVWLLKRKPQFKTYKKGLKMKKLYYKILIGFYKVLTHYLYKKQSISWKKKISIDELIVGEKQSLGGKPAYLYDRTLSISRAHNKYFSYLDVRKNRTEYTLAYVSKSYDNINDLLDDEQTKKAYALMILGE